MEHVLKALDEHISLQEYQLKSARADIAAKDAEIAKLKAQIDAHIQTIAAQGRQIDSANAENRRLRERLEDDQAYRRPCGHGVDPEAESREYAALTEAYCG